MLPERRAAHPSPYPRPGAITKDQTMTRESFYRRRLFTRFAAQMLVDCTAQTDTRYSVEFDEVVVLMPRVLTSPGEASALAFEILWKAGFEPIAESDGAVWQKAPRDRGRRYERVDLEEWDSDVLISLAAEKLGV